MSTWRRTRRLWYAAQKRLSGDKLTQVLLGGGRLLTLLICVCMGLLVQHAAADAKPWARDGATVLAMLLALLAAAPMRTETARQLAAMVGALNDDDRGFLDQSSRLWLWGRAALLRFLWGCCLIAAFLPFLLGIAAARVIRLTLPTEGDALLPLMTLLHVYVLIPASLWIPLRVWAAATALPFSLLKMPEISPLAQLRLAFRLTRGQTAAILLPRLICLPAMLLPNVCTTVLGAELMRCAGRHRRL